MTTPPARPMTPDELLTALEEAEATRPLVLVAPGSLTDAQLAYLRALGAEVREDEATPPGRLLWVNRAALDPPLPVTSTAAQPDPKRGPP